LLIKHQGHLQWAPFAPQMIELLRQLMQIRRFSVVLIGIKTTHSWTRFILLIFIDESFDFKELVGLNIIVEIRICFFRYDFLFVVIFNNVQRVFNFGAEFFCLWIEARVHLNEFLLLSLLLLIESIWWLIYKKYFLMLINS
jgi:hypothetical protein